MKEVWLLDYGAGNVRSLRNAVSSLGWVVRDVTSAADIDAANILLFPGVGAFGSAMAVLRSRGLVEPLVRYVPFVLAGWQWLPPIGPLPPLGSRHVSAGRHEATYCELPT